MEMEKILAICRALSDGGRLRALMALAGGELCVCQIVELLELAPSTVSKHMAVLHQAGLVETRKDGRWIYYSLAGRDGSPHVLQSLEWLRESLADDPQVRRDAARLECVRKTDRDEFCVHYRK